MCEILASSVVREIYVTFVFSHGSLLLGMVTAFPACLIPQLKKEGFVLDTLTESVLGSICFFMGSIGILYSTIFIGKTGRKRILQTLLCWYAIGMFIVASSQNILVLCVGLIITSAIICFIQPVILTYISETCRKRNRGVLISGSFVFMAFGSALVYLLNGFFTWRTIATISAIIGVLGFFQCIIIPETKYWHLLEKNKEQAMMSLLWFEPILSESDVERKLLSISQSIHDDPNAKAGRLLELIKNLRYKKYLVPVLLGLILSLLRSGNGRAIFAIFIMDIFVQLEVPYNPVTLCTIFGVFEMVGSVAVLILVYKCNRKNVIYASSGILVICMLVIIVHKFLINENIEIVPAWLVVICVYTYSLISMAALNSSMSVILSEIQHAYYRAEITTVNAGTNNLFLGLYAFLFPYAEKLIAVEYVMCFFAANVILTVIVVFVFFPETSKFEFFENTKKKRYKHCATEDV